nr:hypothetical protein [Tanacetum cinerariifolium]
MFAYSNDSRRRSYHSSRRDTESCYRNSRSREIEFSFERRHGKRASSQSTKELSKSEGSAGGHWKSKPKRQKPNVEDDFSQPWAVAKMERWRMPTWCHMFNSMLTGNARVWFGNLPKESIDSYDDLEEAFLENYLQQKKCIKDPVDIRNIKQRDGESTKEFVRRYKLECRDVKGAPKCMKISGFMHEITNPELIKRLHDKISKSIDEMMRQEAGQKQTFKKGGFRNQQRPKRKQDRFTLLTKIPEEILALDKGKFKPPTPMTTPVEKRNPAKFYEFHKEVGHTTDECMHLKRQIEEILKAGKLSHLIKELKPNGHAAEQQNHSPRMLAQQPVIDQVTEEKIQVAIHPEYPEQTIAIGSTLTEEERKELCSMLRRNLDIFAWKPANMTGVPRHIAEHNFNIREECQPVRQKKRVSTRKKEGNPGRSREISRR